MPQNHGEKAFARAVSFLIDILEGGDKAVVDTGGLTRWGISKKAYPGVDIENLSRSGAEDIYRRDYWNRIKGDLLPGPIAFLVFVAAVNIGVHQAVLILQRALSVEADGVIGPQTLIAARGFKPGFELRARFNELVLRSYIGIARNKPVYSQYLYGWSMRVFRAADEAGRWA